jgi:CIC family chloride channel protein
VAISVSVGLLAGFAAKALESGIQFGVANLIGRVAHPESSGILHFHGATLLLPALGGLLSGVLVGLLCRPSRAHGTAVLIDAFHHQGAELSLRDALLKAAAAAALIACGGSVGKEAPIAVLGAALGTTVARCLRMHPRERRLFLVAGCAAGVGAIFQCPLGGAVFATTVLYREPEIEADALLPSFVASVTSYSTFMAFGGYGHRLLEGTEKLAFRHPAELIPYFLLALACALVAILFYSSLKLVSSLPVRKRLPRWLSPAAAGLLMGLIACGIPQVMDARYGFLQGVLERSPEVAGVPWMIPALFLAIVLLAKLVATSLMIGADSAGGIFGPVVFMGGVVGAFCGAGLEAIFPGIFPDALRQAMIPVGMAGLLSASLRTPLAAIVMVTEMTGSYGLIVPLMLVSMVSYLLGRRWGVYSEQVGSPKESPAHAGESMVSMLETWRVRDVMDGTWPYLTGPGRTLKELISQITPKTAPSFVVLDGRRPVGTISAAELAEIPEEAGSIPVIVAADLMTPHPTLVHPEEDLYGTLDAFRRYRRDVLPVVDRETGDFLGVLARDSIVRALRMRLREQRMHLLREHAGISVLAEETLLEGLLTELSDHAEGRIERRSLPEETVGKSLRTADFRARWGCQVIALQSAREGLLAPPDPDRILEREDVLVVVLGDRRERDATTSNNGQEA